MLPRAARFRPAIDDEEVLARHQPELLQVVGNRESGLSCADDDDAGMARVIGHAFTLPVTAAPPHREAFGMKAKHTPAVHPVHGRHGVLGS